MDIRSSDFLYGDWLETLENVIVKTFEHNTSLLHLYDYFLCKLEKWRARTYVLMRNLIQISLLLHFLLIIQISQSDFMPIKTSNFLYFVHIENISPSDMEPDLLSCNCDFSKITEKSLQKWLQ